MRRRLCTPEEMRNGSLSGRASSRRMRRTMRTWSIFCSGSPGGIVRRGIIPLEAVGAARAARLALEGDDPVAAAEVVLEGPPGANAPGVGLLRALGLERLDGGRDLDTNARQVGQRPRRLGAALPHVDRRGAAEARGVLALAGERPARPLAGHAP